MKESKIRASFVIDEFNNFKREIEQLLLPREVEVENRLDVSRSSSAEKDRGTIFSLLNPTGIPRRIIETDLPSPLTFLQPDIPRFSDPNQPFSFANLAPSRVENRADSRFENVLSAE